MKEYVIYIPDTNEIRTYTKIPEYIFYVSCDGIPKSIKPILIGEL